MGVALSVTAFPVLARILAEIKLLNCDLGRIAMSAAIVNDMCSWILLALSIAITDTKASPLSSLYVLLSGVVFVLICFFVVRPIMWWVSRQIREGETAKDSHVCLILAGVLLASIITDAIGIHSFFGSFVYGLIIPNGPLSIALIEKLEDFITGLLLPLFFAISGLRTNIAKLNDFITVGLLVLVFALASVGKIAGTLLVAAFCNMPFREGLALGFLMNTRGLIEMIILNIGRDKEVLDDESFATMVLVSVTLTALVTPIVTNVYRSSRLRVGYKRRNLQLAKPDSELRLLVCVHTPRNIPSIISLLDISNPTKRAPIFTYALHLVELTSRASNMLIVHNYAGINKTLSSASTSATALSPHIFTPFETYEQQVGGVSVQQMTTVSPYSTMHEDVCNLAEDRHVSLIVLPFHKQQTVDGSMEPINPSIKSLNENILASAPCSVAIFVDRGLSASTARLTTARYVAVLFFGGPDDREALSFASRLVGNVNVSLTVVRFILAEGQDSVCAWSSSSAPDQIAISIDEIVYQRALDDECLHEFLIRTRGNNSISYTEKVVQNSEEAVGAIQNMESMHEFYIVGRGYKENSGSTLTETLKQWTECPELGPIGDMLVSSDFSRVVSVLVVQQYVPDGPPVIPTPAPAGFGRE
ncbi:hypothetical protein LUZ60_011061 [Juncus effusus]|nr:hypothetical protein LUZ60_011061 [Juncus effusus]